jgi:predicted phosphodiesterase
VTTAVLSDLHLGARTSLLRTAAARSRLVAELGGVDQVVLLGDLLALREGPVEEVLETARPTLEVLGEALDDRRVVIVPGNHDHHLIGPVLEHRRLNGARRPLGNEWIASAEETGPLGLVADLLSSAEVRVAYPGLWIRPDVYATHGHYLDCHMTVPRLECLFAAIMKTLTGGLPARGVSPDDYEATLAPIYAFAYSRAQALGAAGDAARAAGILNRLTRYGWGRLKEDGRGRVGPRGVLGGVAALGAVTALNRTGLGPFRADLSPAELDRAGVQAMGEVITRLEIDAAHVIFGHTHRAGPLEGDTGWTLPGGTRLWNPGSWVYSATLVGQRGGRSPYWPGRCAFVGDSGHPELRSVLTDVELASSRVR